MTRLIKISGNKSVNSGPKVDNSILVKDPFFFNLCKALSDNKDRSV